MVFDLELYNPFQAFLERDAPLLISNYIYGYIHVS